MSIAGFDEELWSAMQNEKQRQEDHIELIASENNVSPRVLQAQGSVLTNKYAEGYPGKRYYGGCEYVDVVENNWLSTGQSSYLVRILPMCNHIPVPRPTVPFTWP